eukprot:7119056-Pyramimonas_sp.AAC.1
MAKNGRPPPLARGPRAPPADRSQGIDRVARVRPQARSAPRYPDESRQASTRCAGSASSRRFKERIAVRSA